MIWNYVYLNPGLSIVYNGQKYFSENGLHDLLQANIDSTIVLLDRGIPTMKIELSSVIPLESNLLNN